MDMDGCMLESANIAHETVFFNECACKATRDCVCVCVCVPVRIWHHFMKKKKNTYTTRSNDLQVFQLLGENKCNEKLRDGERADEREREKEGKKNAGICYTHFISFHVGCWCVCVSLLLLHHHLLLCVRSSLAVRV